MLLLVDVPTASQYEVDFCIKKKKGVLLGVGNMANIVYHDMIILFHGKNIYHDIVIFALNKVLMISIIFYIKTSKQSIKYE